MKKLQYSSYAFALAALMGMTACQSEEVAPVSGQSATQDVVVTLGVGLGEDTRTLMVEEGRDLKTVWEDDDVIVVLGNDDDPYGILTLTSGDGETNAVFEGTLKNVPSESSTFTFLYAGNGSSYDELEKDGTGINPDISNQQGTLSRLTDNDVLIYQNWYTPVDGQLTVSSVVLTRNTSFGHFSLSFPDGVKRNAETITITNSEGLLRTTYGISKNSDGEYSFINGSDNSTITITPDAAAQSASDYDGNEVYVMFLPNSGSNNFDLNFSVEIDGKEYTGHLDPRSGGWAINDYVNVGEGKGVVVEMTAEEEVTVDHSLNPLLKWAEGNLVKSGSGASATGTIASSWTITGSYYQFGRNHGYSSVTDAQTNYMVERSDMPSSNNVYAGTGSTTRLTTYYASSVNFSSYTNYFLIASAFDGDYTTPDHTQTWSERAKSNGYTYETPCPSGWRLPTVAEYKEILPVIDEKAGNSGSSAWTTLVQLKTLSDNKTKVAFRWSKYSYSDYSYLKIECLVVPSSLISTSEVDWTDSNVVTRYFKGAGYIQAQRNLWQFANNGVSSIQYTARPLEWGSYTGTVGGSGTSGVIVVSQAASYMKYGGFYWTSDAVQGVFSMVFNSSTGYTLGYYLSTYGSAIGVNIRCVKDE